MTTLIPCTRDAALDAVRHAAHDGIIAAVLGDVAANWQLTNALRFITDADEVGYDPDLAHADGYGLVALDGSYGDPVRFAATPRTTTIRSRRRTARVTRSTGRPVTRWIRALIWKATA